MGFRRRIDLDQRASPQVGGLRNQASVGRADRHFDPRPSGDLGRSCTTYWATPGTDDGSHPCYHLLSGTFRRGAGSVVGHRIPGYWVHPRSDHRITRTIPDRHLGDAFEPIVPRHIELCGRRRLQRRCPGQIRDVAVVRTGESRGVKAGDGCLEVQLAAARGEGAARRSVEKVSGLGVVDLDHAQV